MDKLDSLENIGSQLALIKERIQEFEHPATKLADSERKAEDERYKEYLLGADKYLSLLFNTAFIAIGVMISINLSGKVNFLSKEQILLTIGIYLISGVVAGLGLLFIFFIREKTYLVHTNGKDIAEFYKIMEKTIDHGTLNDINDTEKQFQNLGSERKKLAFWLKKLRLIIKLSVIVSAIFQILAILVFLFCTVLS